MDAVTGMPLWRNEEATITKVGERKLLGRCYVRARFGSRQAHGPATAEVLVNGVRWEAGHHHSERERYLLRFPDQYAIEVELVDLLGQWEATLQGILGPGDERIQ